MRLLSRKSSICLIIMCMVALFPHHVWAAENPALQSVQAEAYYLMDVKSGVILAEKDAETPRPPASMTKMMAQLLVLEQIKQGTIKWDDPVKVSPRAAAINEAEIQLKPNEEMSIKELFIASVVKSANDATVALAEHIAGSETKFVEMMNVKASELGMKGTHFRNATGLNMEEYGSHAPEGSGEHEMGAHDSAILANTLIKEYPEILEYTSIANYTFRKGTAGQVTVKNYNWMLPERKKVPYEGVDGLKTGHTNEAGFCFTGTAKRGDFRVISVVMKTSAESKRFSETKKLLDYAFTQYEPKTLLKTGEAVPGFENLTLPNGVEETIGVQTKSDVYLPMKKRESQKYQYKVTFLPDVKAPILAGQEVGKVEVLYDGKTISGLQQIPLVSAKDMEEGSWIRLFFRSVGNEVESWFE